MNLGEALEQLDAIHTHLARTEHYHGYRPAALGSSGLGGLAAGLMQPALEPVGYVVYWVVVALICSVLAGGATVLGYLFREDALARRRTRIVVRQFAPCQLAGLIVTLTLAHPRRAEWAVALLPGLWALLYGLGIVASLPFLPRLAGLIAAWYLLAGLVLLSLAEAPVPPGWAVGVPFGLGQLFSALTLFVTPREPHP